MKKSHCRNLLVVVMTAMLAAGCGNKTSEPKKASTQVAAKVNSTEITISQVNSVLARTPNVTPENTERVKREILDRLIDAELAKEEAVSKKLDRSPNVLQTMEAAKTEVLARAYVEQFASQQPKPTPEEIKKYYNDHPEFFTQRRVFNVEEIALPGTDGLAPKLREQIGKTRSMTAIANWLKSQGIQFTANSGVRFTEQIPADYQQQMQSMKDDEIRLFENSGALILVHVVASKTAPVDEAHAAPRIQQYLFTQRSSAALATDMKQLKEKAKIEYVGEFSTGAAEAQSKAKAEAEQKAKSQAEAKSKSDADARAKESQVSAARAAADAKAKEEAATQAQVNEAARKRAADAKARADAEDAKGRSAPARPELEKGVSGLIK
ncbi:MAG: epsD [Betaproteobacteria bacterium]|nr:epsD [Betaproteobacteria bacterium]